MFGMAGDLLGYPKENQESTNVVERSENEKEAKNCMGSDTFCHHVDLVECKKCKTISGSGTELEQNSRADQVQNCFLE